MVIPNGPAYYPWLHIFWKRVFWVNQLCWFLNPKYVNVAKVAVINTEPVSRTNRSHLWCGWCNTFLALNHNRILAKFWIELLKRMHVIYRNRTKLPCNTNFFVIAHVSIAVFLSYTSLPMQPFSFRNNFLSMSLFLNLSFLFQIRLIYCACHAECGQSIFEPAMWCKCFSARDEA